MSNKNTTIILKKFDFELSFDKLFQAVSSHVCGSELRPTTPDYAAPAMDTQVNMQLQLVHSKLGHCGEDYTRSTLKYYEWKVTGGFKPCEDCAIAKAKQSSVNKVLSEKSKIPGERWFIDTTSVKRESLGGTKFWLGILDDCTDLFISKFLKNKSQVGDVGEYHLWTSKRTDYRQLNERDYTTDKYEMLAIC